MADPTAQVKITPAHKRKLFIEAYLGNARGNGTKAARIAGYEFPAEEAYRLLRNAQVRARIDERLAEAAISANEVLAELTDIAKSEWRDFIEILEWDDEGNPLKVKMDLSQKVKSLELLGKHHQLFSENLNIHGGIEIREYVNIPDDLP